MTSTSDGEKYHCDEIWRYTFVVLDVEDVLDVETEVDYFGLRSMRGASSMRAEVVREMQSSLGKGSFI